MRLKRSFQQENHLGKKKIWSEEKGDQKEKKTSRFMKKETKKDPLKKTVRKGTGLWRKINGTIGSWKSIIVTSSVNKWGDWTRSSRPWQSSLAAEKLNNAEAITKRWKRNTAHSLIFFCSSEEATMPLKTARQLPKIWRSTKSLKQVHYWAD